MLLQRLSHVFLKQLKSTLTWADSPLLPSIIKLLQKSMRLNWQILIVLFSIMNKLLITSKVTPINLFPWVLLTSFDVCCTGEESNSSANKCLLKVAQYAAQLENYQKAIQIYEQVASSSLDNSLLKYSAKEYFFRAALCHLCIDMLNAQHALQQYENMYPAFQVCILVVFPCGSTSWRLLRIWTWMDSSVKW